jgi:hypothetical protein
LFPEISKEILGKNKHSGQVAVELLLWSAQTFKQCAWELCPQPFSQHLLFIEVFLTNCAASLFTQENPG